MFIKYEAEVSSRVGGGERGVVDFGKLFTETNEQKFSFGDSKDCVALRGLGCQIQFLFGRELASVDKIKSSQSQAEGVLSLV